ncbi:MAG: PAS domain S-box protein [Thermodesulfobacteriota bacterium]
MKKRCNPADGARHWRALLGKMFGMGKKGDGKDAGPAWQKTCGFTGDNGNSRMEIMERQRLTADLQNACSLLKSLVDSIPDLIFYKDTRGAYLGCNRAFARFVGHPEEEIIGLTDLDLFPRELAGFFRDNDQQILSSGEARCNEEWVAYPDGRRVLLDTLKTPYYDNEGNVLGLIGVSRDITTRQRSAEALQESERKLSTLLANLPGMAYRCANDPDWAMEFVSDGCRELTGYNADELIGNRVVAYAKLIHPDDQAFVWNGVQEGVARKRPFQLTYRLRNAAGQEKWVLEQGEGVFAEDGSLLALEGFITDITMRKRAEDEVRRNYETQTAINALLDLAQSNLPLDDLLPRTLDIILSSQWFSPEKKGCILLLADDRQNLVLKAGLGLADSLPIGALVPADRCPCGQALSTGGIQHVAQADDCQANTFKAMGCHDYYCVPILVEGQAIGSVLLLLPAGHRRDPQEEAFLLAVTKPLADIIQRRRMMDERAKLERQLRQAQKMESIGTLAGGIAHDFNNILSAIMGYGELASIALAADSPAYQDIQQVLVAAERAKQLVSQILTFSRQGEQGRQPVLVHLIVKEALKLLRSSIPATIQICENIRTDCGAVLAEPSLIHQIIMNLCTNAYHAMREGGGLLTVGLTCTAFDQDEVRVGRLNLAPGPYLQLEVRDSGHGMDRAVLERIFEPYFTTKKKGEGTGLGLSVVHGIVNSLGGHISVYSEPGNGATFQVFLPLLDSAAGEQDTGETHLLPRGDERILVVDDEEQIIRIERRMLEDLGYQVKAFTSSEEALQFFLAVPDKFDLIITDMTMPHLTGAELAKRVMQERADIPIILCSGFSDLLNEEQARALGIRQYIMKPIVRKKLAQAVSNVLHGHGAAGQD